MKACGYATASGYVGYDPDTGKKMIFATEAEYLEWLEDDENTENKEETKNEE